MPVLMTPDLPETYYLDNVLTLFQHVEQTYADILNPDQIEFLTRFSGFDEDARKLYIRLLNRSNDWFRVSKLSYAEIGSLEDAIETLCHGDCLRLNPELNDSTLLSLFTKPELLAALDQNPALGKLRRQELETELMNLNDRGYFNELNRRDDFLEVLNRDHYQLCQMLFFGNLNQSMTDFVLRDLGLNQYESYSIDPAHRPYRSSLEIQQHWLLHQLGVLLEQVDRTDPAILIECFDMIPVGIEVDAPAYRKSENLRYEISRQLERIGHHDEALQRFQHCHLPPSRERITRIYDHQGHHQQALEHCIQIVDNPIDDEELQFACMFAARLCKRHQFEAPLSIQQHSITHKPDIVELELQKQESVEIAVAEYYGEGCYYLENSLFNGVLGLLLWDVIFAAKNGSFFNPFQHRPSDLYAHDFLHRRRELLQQLWASIHNNQDIWQIVLARWPQKYGLMNPFVNWQDLNLDIIELALERIEHQQWLAVFERILHDLRFNRAGFPDLVYFPPAGGYQLIEVKGPGDTLQKNQQRWMQYFKQQGIAHHLVRVKWNAS
jgi:hypothetical protein